MSQPLFSIVMPVYNMENYLQQAVDCIRKQTMDDYELILVNDASRDHSLEICRRNECEKIHVVDLKKNGGLSNARNEGLSIAKGKYILFLDPDDTYAHDLLEKLDNAVRQYQPDLLIYGLKEEYYNANGKVEYEKVIEPRSVLNKDKKSIYAHVLELESKTLFGYAWNKCYRTELLKEKGIRFKKVKMIEDIQFNLEVLPYVKSIKTLEIDPYSYAIRPNASLTHQHLADYFQLHTTRIQLFLEEYERNMPELLEACKQTMAPIYCRYLLSAIARYDQPDLKHWLSQVFDSSLFQTLYPYMRFTGKKKWIYGPIRSKNAVLCIVAGKSAGFVKEKLPSLFAKAKQTR